jgi:hypothetical protein
VGNRLLTLLSNCLTNLNLTDMETCYKAFRREIIQSIPIEENRFGFEPEITVKIAKRRLRIYEIGISYWAAPTNKARKSAGRTGFAASGAYSNTRSKNQPSPYRMRPAMNSAPHRDMILRAWQLAWHAAHRVMWFCSKSSSPWLRNSLWSLW